MKLCIFFFGLLLARCNGDVSSAHNEAIKDSTTIPQSGGSVLNNDISSELADTITASEEDFDSFFAKFDKDRSFQYSRIEFPLKLITEDVTRFLSKKEWKFTTLSNKQSIKGQIKKTQVSKDEVKMEYSIEDTGVLVNHFFRIKNGKWWLVYIQDESD
jgi:hypothetical protein